MVTANREIGKYTTKNTTNIFPLVIDQSHFYPSLNTFRITRLFVPDGNDAKWTGSAGEAVGQILSPGG
jgi:hypothetical protein